VIVADHEARLIPTARVVVAGGIAALARADEVARVRIRTGPGAAPEGAQRDGDGWILELPRDEAQAVLGQLVRAGIEIREVRPL
jgi:hypothetical protein